MRARVQGRLDAALVAAGTLGLMWFTLALVRASHQEIEHDARGYMWIAQVLGGAVTRDEIPAEFLDELFGIRLVGYPLFVAPFTILGLSGVWLRVGVALVQLAVYWGAVALLARALSTYGVDTARRRICVVLLALPFPYILAVEVLAESLSLSLAIVVTATAMLSVRATRGRVLWFIATVTVAGAAQLVRPDNLYIAAIPVCVVGVGVLGDRLPGSSRLGVLRAVLGTGVATAAAIGLWRIPQYLATRWYFGSGSFTTPDSLTDMAMRLGIETVKWTSGIGAVTGGIRYRNPFLSVEGAEGYSSTPLDWYRDEPLQGVALVVLKYFALLDQDAPYPYNETIPDGAPWWLFFVNHTLVVFGCAGIVWLTVRWVKDRRMPRRELLLPFLVTGGVWLAIHTLPHVESRYGLPALTGLAISAAAFASPERVRRHWRALGAGLAVYLPVAFLVSDWLRSFRVT